MDKNKDNKDSGLNGFNSEYQAEFLRLIWNGTINQMCLSKMVFDDHGTPIDYIILDINPAYEKAFGLTKDQVINKRVSELLGYYTPKWIEKCGEAVRSGNNLLSVECIFKASLWFEVQVFPLGSGDQFITIAQDITKQKEEKIRTENEITSNKIANHSLIERLELMNMLMDNNPSLIFLKDEYGRYEYLNKTYEQYFVGSKNWYGKTDFDLWSKESAELFRANDQAVMKTGRVTQYLEDSKDLDGTRYCWLNYKFPYTDSKNRRYLVGVGIDVTKRILAEETLRKTEEELQSYVEALKTKEQETLELIDSFTEGSWIVDILAGTLMCSEKWSKRIGLDLVPEEERMSYVGTLSHPDDTKGANSIPYCLKTGATEFELEYRVKTVDSGYIWTKQQGKIVYNEQGQAVKVYAATFDISQSRQAEEALQESERFTLDLVEKLRKADKNKDNFLNMLSHELRNPLASIMTSLDLMDKLIPGGEQNSKELKIAKRQGKQLTNLVDDLLDVTRITQNKVALKKETLEINEIINKAVQDYLSQLVNKNVNLEIRLTTPLYIEADSSRITQVMGNLLHNAAKFTRSNDSVTVTVAHEMNSNDVVITIQDTGRGIDHTNLENLFEPFMQVDKTLDRSDGGLGLGLAIVKGMVELHGGRVEVFSEGIGKGTRFTIMLPLTEENVSVQEFCEKLESKSSKPLKIHMIEDNKDLNELVCELIELLGHEVTASYDGPDGIAKARDLRPDVIISDIGLPGMNGYEVANLIRKDNNLKDTFMIALSGYAQSEDIEKSKQAGFNRHLGKPVSIETLQKVLNELK